MMLLIEITMKLLNLRIGPEIENYWKNCEDLKNNLDEIKSINEKNKESIKNIKETSSNVEKLSKKRNDEENRGRKEKKIEKKKAQIEIFDNELQWRRNAMELEFLKNIFCLFL